MFVVIIMALLSWSKNNFIISANVFLSWPRRASRPPIRSEVRYINGNCLVQGSYPRLGGGSGVDWVNGGNGELLRVCYWMIIWFEDLGLQVAWLVTTYKINLEIVITQLWRRLRFILFFLNYRGIHRECCSGHQWLFNWLIPFTFHFRGVMVQQLSQCCQESSLKMVYFIS